MLIRRRVHKTFLAIAVSLCAVVGAFAAPVSSVTLDEVLADDTLHREHSTVLRLYRAVLGRAPEGDGAQFWIDAYDSGQWDTRRIAAHFAVSDEFVATYGPQLSNRQFTEVVYRNVLGRGPDNDGFVFWLGQLDAGMERSEMILLISNAPEFINANPLASDTRPATGPRGQRSPFCDWVAGAMERHGIDRSVNWQILTGPEVQRRYGARAMLIWSTSESGEHFGGPALAADGSLLFDDLVGDYSDLLLAGAATHHWIDGGDRRWSCRDRVALGADPTSGRPAADLGVEAVLDRFVWAWAVGDTAAMQTIASSTVTERALAYDVLRARHDYLAFDCTLGSSGFGACDVAIETTSGEILHLAVQYGERRDPTSGRFSIVIVEMTQR